ncbi:LuxR C-terminal-related transcriptional regulator [Enterobacter sp. CC120223-11]|uniref:LuxR C-terminal-related transcriptional regulator n=1 Tax=Enterobacter sp. CC120223-11 TaxID=1378073 RepID=UPI0015966F75|nr:LuxR C-terminal-related transcriptional regulator [Enterobacter sp. CC120223-11]
MKQGNIAVPSLFLYEPRLLMRMLVASRVETDFPSLEVYPLIPPSIENLTGTFPGNKVLLFGVGGAGHSLYELLRAVRKMKSLKVKTIGWLPCGYPWLQRLMRALGVKQVICEEELDAQLYRVLRETISSKPPAFRPTEDAVRTKVMTQTELEILLQFAAGLSSKEMAERRGCSYKTIFSWKHNICEALAVESHAQWLELLSELVQLTSLYRAD